MLSNKTKHKRAINQAGQIREIRLALGLTQEQFAVELGVTFPTVNRWENSKTTPSPLALQKLERMLIKLKKKGAIKLNGQNFEPILSEGKA